MATPSRLDNLIAALKKASNVAFLFLIVGIVLTTLGTIYTQQFNNLTDIFPSAYSNANSLPILMLSTGCIMIFFSMFYRCVKDEKCGELVVSFIFVVLLLQFVAGILAFTQNQQKLQSGIKEETDVVYRKYQNDPKSRDLVDYVQQYLECCGTTGPSYWNQIALKIPTSCYEGEDESTTPYSKGCQKSVFSFITLRYTVIGSVAFAALAMEVVYLIYRCHRSGSYENI